LKLTIGILIQMYYIKEKVTNKKFWEEFVIPVSSNFEIFMATVERDH
jgi:hypothetical protein